MALSPEQLDRLKELHAKYSGPVSVEEKKQQVLPDNRSLLQKAGGAIMAGANAVTDFVGARGIADTYAADIARVGATDDEKRYLDQMERPSVKETVGSAIQTGSNFIPGAGIGASVARKAGIGAVTGLGMDVGAKLQADKPVQEAVTPGIGTVTGATVPLLGKMIGAAPKALEKMNLRMTPVEMQNLQKQGKDIVDWMTRQKVVGTPQQRLAKVVTLYDKMEERVQKALGDAGVALPKETILNKVREATKDYADDPLALPEVERAIQNFEAYLANKKTFAIPVATLNTVKRNIFERAFSKNKADVVSDANYAIGAKIKELLDTEVPGLEKLNREYANILTARRVLNKAATRNQAGLITRSLATGVGAAAGGSFGNFAGAAVGGILGERLANTLATPVRSATGATVQTLNDILTKLPVDEQGNIPVKLLIQALAGEEDKDTK